MPTLYINVSNHKTKLTNVTLDTKYSTCTAHVICQCSIVYTVLLTYAIDEFDAFVNG